MDRCPRCHPGRSQSPGWCTKGWYGSRRWLRQRTVQTDHRRLRRRPHSHRLTTPCLTGLWKCCEAPGLSTTPVTYRHHHHRHHVVSVAVFTRVLAIAILSVRLSVCLSVTRVDQSKAVQARITKSSPSATWKILVSGTVKLFHKFEGGHPKRGR